MTGSVSNRPGNVGAQRQVGDDVAAPGVEGDPRFIQALLDSFPEFAVHNKAVSKKGGPAGANSTRQTAPEDGPPVPNAPPATANGMRQLSSTAGGFSSMSTSGGNEMADMFVVMMSYLKMVQKEAREDRKIERMSNEIKLVASEKKADMDIKKIDAEMMEAGQKVEAQMAAAVTQLVTSCVSAAIQIAAASVTIAGGSEPTSGFKAAGQFLGAADGLVKGIGGYIAADQNAEVNRIDERGVSKKLAQKAIQQEVVVKRLENDASKDKDFADSSKAHRDRIRDAVLDLLRKMSEIKGLY